MSGSAVGGCSTRSHSRPAPSPSNRAGVTRLVEDDAELVLQVFQDASWTDMYGFVPEPAEPVDIEVNNWYTATHPESPFVTGIMVGLRSADRCLSLFVYEQPVLVERPVGEASNLVEVRLDEVPALLAERFGIMGVALGDDRRLILHAADGA
jgi:N-hydroxyarylamine O-acetyltransferase